MPFFAALIPAAIAGVGSIGAALIGKSSADKNAAAQSATSAKVDAYGAPYRAAGTNALADLQTANGEGDPATLAARRATLDSNFENSPLYKYTYQPAVEQATLDAQKQGSSGGFLDSGRTIKAIQDRAARIGGQTFGNYLGTIEQTANNGQNAAFNSGNQAQTGQNALGTYTNDAGNALGAGVLGAANAAGAGVGNYFQKMGQSSYGANPFANSTSEFNG